MFAETGLSAPLSTIARRAGVGQGSLYRHFPDRIALALAVFDDNITELELLAARPDARLSELFDSVAEQAMGSGALIDLITSERHDQRTVHLRTRVETVVDTMLARDQARGRMGAHAVTDDVMLAISMLAFVLARTDAEERHAVAERARQLLRTALGITSIQLDDSSDQQLERA